MTSRPNRIAAALDGADLDGAICFLPENVLFFSGYWPSTGDSALIISKKGSKALIISSVDQRFVPSKWDGLVVSYDVNPADVRIGNPREKLIQSIKVAVQELNLNGGNLGCELSFETVAGSFRGSEANMPGKDIFEALSRALPRMNFKDFSDLVRDLRRIKTQEEVGFLRRCNQIAGHAFSRGRERAKPGAKEIEVAAAIESAFQEFGVGYEGTYRARGYAFAMSGPVNSGNAWLPANFSTDRVLQDGDLVLIEFNGFVDGFWTDLSRTLVIGKPNNRQKEMISSVTEALETVVEALKPGITLGSVDCLARASFRSRGVEEYFMHYTGHGVGFAFHEPPILRPDSSVLLKPGMVLAIEPGLYIEGVGGVRIEENVLITLDGAELLSTFDRSPYTGH